MSNSGHGLQVVSVTDTHSFILEESVLRQLLLREDVRDLPVVVVSVAGAYRGGKSFLLNFFIRYLSASVEARADGSWLGDDSAPLVGFQWRSGIQATTLGILMWSEPFINTLPSGEKVAVLLVDTQGTFDSKSSFRDNSTIFALSTLLSSVQIYNLSHNIKEDDLTHLELFTEYGKLVSAGNSNAKAFQVLEFLVRDWQFAKDHPYGAVGGEQLLNNKLQITANMAEEMKQLRHHIRSSFDKVSCFLLPHPGFEVLEPTFNGNIAEIRLLFRKKLVELTNSLFGPDKLLPKTINGQRIKAQHLFNYCKGYLELFNSGDIPSPENILVVTVRAGLLSAVEEARNIYEKGMDAECGPKQPLSLSPSDLKSLHDKYVKLATDDFKNKKKMGSKTEHNFYLNTLTQEINNRLAQFLQGNLAKVQAAIAKAKEAYDNEINNITKGKLFCLHPIDVTQVHNKAVEAAIKIYDGSRKKVTNGNDIERSVFIQGFNKELALLRQTNELNNNTITTQIEMEYWQVMQSKSSLEPPLTASELKKEHDKALTKALENFKTKRNKPDEYTEDVYKYNLAKKIQDCFVQMKSINKGKNKTGMYEGIDAYQNYMAEHYADQCLHPDDLEEINRLAVCTAFTVFRPRKECIGDIFDNDDEDETTMKEVLIGRYNTIKFSNENKNETALLSAYNEYVKKIDDKCSFSWWWVVGLGIPYVVNTSKRSDFHSDCKKIATELFYSKRSSSTYHASDAYKQRLDEKMDAYYSENYESVMEKFGKTVTKIVKHIIENRGLIPDRLS